MADSDHSSTPGKSPAFQFYPKDFLTDENVRMMSLQERGAYITLICLCWTGGTLPADIVWLARLCGTPLAAFRRLWPAIERCFRNHPTDADRLVHPRLEKEHEKQVEFRRRQSDKGRASGASRLNRKATETNHGSIPVQPALVQPKANSSISNLQSSDSSQHPRKEREGVPHTRMGSGVMAGSLPRDHLRHSWCGRVCVPDFLHGQFERSTGQVESTLKAFYNDTFTAISEDEPVEPDAVKFWRPRVSARWPPASPSSSLKPEDLLFTEDARARR